MLPVAVRVPHLSFLENEDGSEVQSMTPATNKPAELGRIRPHLREKLVQIEPQKIVQIAGMALADPEVVTLHFGESDVPTAEFINKAAYDALQSGHTFYTHRRGIPELRDSLARHMTGLYGVSIDSDRVTVTPSAMQALMLTMMGVLEEDDNIVVIGPIWPNAVAAVPLAGGVPHVVNLRSGNNGWSLDLDELFDACDARTRGIFINSPANPTGWTITREQQQSILEFARANGLWIIADEIYTRIVYDRPVAPSFLEICEPEDPVIVIGSFSKSWAMTGWRLGWITTPPSLGGFLENLIEYSSSGTATFVQHAGVTAVEDGEPFVASMVERCRAGREIVGRYLAALPRVRYQEPNAAFYAFFAIEGMDDSLEFAKELVRTAKVSVAPGVAFGPAGEGWLRLCFARSAESLEMAMERLSKALS